MPVVYRCRSCGFILHVYERVGQDRYGIPTPSRIAIRYGGRCPRCGAPLGTPSLGDILVIPLAPRRKEATPITSIGMVKEYVKPVIIELTPLDLSLSAPRRKATT